MKKLELFLFQQIYYFYCCLILRRSLLNRPFSRRGRRSLPRVKKIPFNRRRPNRILNLHKIKELTSQVLKFLINSIISIFLVDDLHDAKSTLETEIFSNFELKVYLGQLLLVSSAWLSKKKIYNSPRSTKSTVLLLNIYQFSETGTQNTTRLPNLVLFNEKPPKNFKTY